MRTLHWAPQYGSKTGTGKAIKEWLEASASAGLDVAVVSSPNTGEPSGMGSGYQVYSAPGLAHQLALFRREAKSANIVHLHGAFDLKLTAAYLVLACEKLRRLITGEPLMIALTPHGALSQQVFSRSVLKKRLYWNCVDRPLSKLLSHGICTTPVEASDLHHLMPHVKTAVVPLVISRTETSAVEPKTATPKSTSRVPVLCTLGRYDIGMKGLDLLISAVKKLNADGCPVRLRCIGYDRNHGTQVLEDYVRSVNATEFVECTGPKYGHEKDLAVAECDVFCVSSRFESFSYALIEGLESGLPVLVGSGACLTSYFDDDQVRTMVVAPDADAWSISIKRVLTDPADNRRCADRVLQNLRQICAPRIVGESLGKVYRAMVAGTSTQATSGNGSTTRPPV